LETIDSAKKAKRKIKVIGNIKKYFKSKKHLIDEVGHLTHQIKLMQDHIVVQKEEILSREMRINELERQVQVTKNLLDVSSNTKRY
jgi:polyhydroxyalkanoate synthesis regulator phasin